MKIFSFAIVLSLLLFSCQTNNANLKELSEFNEDTGDQIDSNLGLHWIDNMKVSGLGPKHGESYNVSSENLQKIMNQEDIMGITLHYGLDASGVQHILLTPITKNMAVWSGVVIDANTNSEVNLETAQDWAENFKNANQGAILRYSYGINMFTEIQKHPGFEVVPALDDAKKPVLLMIMHRDAAGRTNDGPPIIYDNGVTCPPYC